MKGPRRFSYSRLRVLFLALGLLLLLLAQACSTYSPSHGYPTSTYAYPPQGIAYYPSHGYYSHRYYGTFQPGWFIGSGYSGAYYGTWVYASPVYWPSHSHYSYRHAFYPYYDPWYYSYTRPYRSPYGYRYGYGYGNPYGGHPYYGSNPYYGHSQTYRPPGQNQPPTQSRPDPVVIPPGQRGRRGASEDFNEQIDQGLRQRETYQPDRRAVTVVEEEQDLSRSVGVAPTQAGDQGITISSRSERKIRESRLQPVGDQTMVVQPGAAENNRQRNYSNIAEQPTTPVTPDIPANSGRRYRSYDSPSRGYEPPADATERTAPAAQYRPPSRQISSPAEPMAVPSANVESVYRQAPPRQQPANRQPYQQPASRQPFQQPQPLNAPAYQQGPASGGITPEPDLRQPPEAEREREDRDH